MTLATVLVQRGFDVIDRRQKFMEQARLALETASALRSHTDNQVAVLRGSIEENTALTREGAVAAKAAFTEANDVNGKIETLAQSNQGILRHIEEKADK